MLLLIKSLKKIASLVDFEKENRYEDKINEGTCNKINTVTFTIPQRPLSNLRVLCATLY